MESRIVSQNNKFAKRISFNLVHAIDISAQFCNDLAISAMALLSAYSFEGLLG